MSFENKIRTLRNERNWGQDFVAKKLNISVPALSRYELGVREPKSLKVIRDFAKLYGVSTDYLFDMEKKPQRVSQRSTPKNIVNLKEMYSDYYIRLWKKQGLRLITERPPTTTQEILDDFFKNRNNGKGKYQQRAIRNERKNARIKKLDWRDFLKEEYK